MRVRQSTHTIEHYVRKYQMDRFLSANLLRHLELFEFPPYTNIYTQQAEQHYFYFLVAGAVHCSHYHTNGKLAVFALSRPFTAIGDVEILSQEPVRSNVVSTEATTMLGIATTAVNRYGADDPLFLRFLIDQLREKLYQTNALQVNQVLPVINRLAVYILSQLDDDLTATLPAKEELASMLGTTSRHLNRVLKELVEADVISATYPRIRVKNRAALCDLTG